MAKTEYWKNKKILVTGATGFIGRHLVDRLIFQEDANVGVFVLDEERSFPYDIPTYRGNLVNLSDIQRAVVRFQPEYVFHLASQPLVDTALRGVMDTLTSNVVGGMNLLHACLDDDALKSLIFVTTDKVYGHSNGADENAHLLGVNHPYNASKVCADVLAQMYGWSFGLPVGIVRSGNIYGGGDMNFDRLIPYACRQVIRGEPIVLRSNGEFLRDYLYIDDIIDGYLMLSQKTANRGAPIVMNFGVEKPVSVMDVVSTVLSVEGKGVEVQIGDTAEQELLYQHLNWGLARRQLGWRPQVSFEEGIKRTYNWYKEYFGESK